MKLPRLLAPALALAVTPAGLAQEVELPDVFTEVIDVRVVNIEVVVTDADGVRVHDLGPEDFRLRVDGQPRPIDYFSEILGGESVRDSEALPGAPGLADGVSTSYLVFIDDFFSIARDRNRVLNALIEDLDRLDPRDRMAIVAFDGRDLEMLTSWTHSRRELERALRRATERRSYGLQRMGELRASERGGFGFRRSLGGGLDPLERSYARRLAGQVERGVGAAIATLRSFASPPGRKVMLLLNGGWPAAPAEFVALATRGSGESAFAATREGLPRYATLLSPLSDAANLLGYTLYPIDVPGMGSGFASDGGFESGLVGREGRLHDSLAFIAHETGGRPLYNSQRLAALETVVEDTRSYYWLGFTLDRAGDDRRHDVEVEVLVPGLRARSREGFVDLSRRSEVTMVVESSLLFGHPASDRPLEVRFGKATRERRGIVRIPMEVGFALDDVTLLPVGRDAYAGEVEVRVTVMDEAGNRSETPIETARVAGSELPEPGQMYWWQTTLLMRRRNHRVVVAVYDPMSGSMFSASAEIFP